MSALGQLTLVRLREFFREPGSLFWVFGFPIILAMALGLAFRSDVQPRRPVWVLSGPEAPKRASVLEADPDLIVRVADEGEAMQALRRGDAFLLVGGDEEPLYRYDPSRPESEGLRLQVDNLLQRAAGREDVFDAEIVPITTQGSRYIDFLIPGLLGLNIMSSSMWGIGWVIVQTRTRKLLKRLTATPMRRRDYLLSHILARLCFLVLEVALLLGFAWLAFDIRLTGSLLALSLLSIFGAMSFGGIGLLVSSRARTSETVSGLMNAIMFPMYLLSGVFFSASNFPDWMQPLIQALPLTALNDGLRAVINEGAGLSAIGLPLTILACWGVISFGGALRLFRWQ